MFSLYDSVRFCFNTFHILPTFPAVPAVNKAVAAPNFMPKALDNRSSLGYKPPAPEAILPNDSPLLLGSATLHIPTTETQNSVP